MECFGFLLTELSYAAGVQQEQHLIERSEDEKEGKSLSRRAIRKDTPRAYAFRIFFNTTMIKANVNAEAREMLMGHTIGLNDAYYKPSSSDILTEYLKAVDYLTINDENRLRKEIKTQKEKDAELNGIKIQQASMQNMLTKLVESLASATDQTELNTNAKSLANSGILKPKTNNNDN